MPNLLDLVVICVFEETKKEKKSREAVLKDWLKKSNLKAERVVYTAEFTVDSSFGVPGAITVSNKHQKEFFLESIVVEGFACGPVHFVCNSWVQSRKDHPGKRIFFVNKVIELLLTQLLALFFLSPLFSLLINFTCRKEKKKKLCAIAVYLFNSTFQYSNVILDFSNVGTLHVAGEFRTSSTIFCISLIDIFDYSSSVLLIFHDLLHLELHILIIKKESIASNWTFSISIVS